MAETAATPSGRAPPSTGGFSSTGAMVIAVLLAFAGQWATTLSFKDFLAFLFFPIFTRGSSEHTTVHA